ncbi:MAG: phosphate transport system regulatory protein PhoU [Bdellovibrio sp.]|nr:MAG: phosphate transport system regulatory protein PhoU [Bdellovibrio sp.]
MNNHLRTQIDKLKKDILDLGEFVQEQMSKSILAVKNFDESLAREVQHNDNEIDRREVEIEEQCLQLLALHQPVAVDLRFIVSVLKINNDLERIGDLSSNIAQRAKYLARKNKLPPPFDLDQMSQLTSEMLSNALEALVNMDSELANEVCLKDQKVDDLNRQTYHNVFKKIKQSPQNTEDLIHYLTISRNLERIADYATNIAEDVIYMVEGIIVRHSNIEI